ncbi:uncharacterized protein LOC142985738 [Anticarsia gemmatalis]|uniref:uncharacterized protein LOC142985738 n=1 Tax=Anticarsia gemmatalis TaxID=129554 RepID=UPI003F7684F1
MTTLSDAQLTHLIASITSGSTRTGSMANCTHTYDGTRRQEDLETFISAVSTFIAVGNIGDSQTLMGIPLVLRQIDMIFGLLHVNIRSHITRSLITTFDDLLEVARGIENTIKEKSMHRKQDSDQRETSSTSTVHFNPSRANNKKGSSYSDAISLTAKIFLLWLWCSRSDQSELHNML